MAREAGEGGNDGLEGEGVLRLRKHKEGEMGCGYRDWTGEASRW